MTGTWFAFAIELIVAGLLATTIGYCVVLNQRLTRLRADETALKHTIVELVSATDSAERAIAGLRATVKDCDSHLGDRIRTAERFTAEIDKQLRNGRDMIDRIAQIAEAARPAAPARAPRGEAAARLDPAPGPGLGAAGVAAFRAAAEAAPARTGATVQVAQALAERARRRAAN